MTVNCNSCDRLVDTWVETKYDKKYCLFCAYKISERMKRKNIFKEIRCFIIRFFRGW